MRYTAMLFSLSLLLPLSSHAQFPVEHASSSDCDAGPVNTTTYTNWNGAINPTTDIIGGGARYSAAPSLSGAITVTDETELRTALSGTYSTQTVIYLDPAGDFEITGTLPIHIPANVTLASDRGTAISSSEYSRGAVVKPYPNSMSAFTFIFDTNASNVRITSLVLQGPYDAIDESISQIEVNGIIARSGATNFVVDNTEMIGWSGSAIRLEGAQQAHIHHNHIHRNHHQYFYSNAVLAAVTAYGVLLHGDSDALIEANLFDNNRHSIAGTGHAGQSYEARYNIVQQHLGSHAFDMHGIASGGSYVAGNEIYIHHNTFLTTQGTSGIHYNIPATGIAIRGVPVTCAWIEHNTFADQEHTSLTAHAIIQQNASGNFRVAASNDFGVGGLLASNGATYEWTAIQPASVTMADVHVGDFTGDGRDDLFKVDGSGNWLLSSGGNGPWQTLVSASGKTFADLRFGKFDTDNKVDVFFIESGIWKMRSGGTGSPITLNSSVYPVADLRFADVNGDGKADIFHRQSGLWEVSYGATGSWTTLKTFSPSSSNPPLTELVFGDFSGDGKADVLHVSGSAWKLYDATTWSPATYATSSLTLADLVFGNFDGTAGIDVLTFDAGFIKIFRPSSGTWEKINKIETGMTTSTVGTGDFNGDGTSELLWNGIPGEDLECDSSGCPFE